MLLYSLVDVPSTLYVALARFMLPKNLAPLLFIKFLVILVIRLHLSDADMLWTEDLAGFWDFLLPHISSQARYYCKKGRCD